MKIDRISLFLSLLIVNAFAKSTRLAEESEEETYRKNVRNLKNMRKLRGKMERLSNPLRQQDWTASSSEASASDLDGGDAEDAMTADEPILRFVTYNIGDNGGMVTKGVHGFKDDLGFQGESVDKLLGIDGAEPAADIFAIGLQEECWKCNKENLPQIMKFFLDRINSKNKGSFVKVAFRSTRRWKAGDAPCEVGCIGLPSDKTHHGTTLMLVIAKRGVVDHTATLKYSFNGPQCSDRSKRKLPPNQEKGVTMVRFTLKKSGKSVTVATSHLDSDSPAKRRECLEGYFNTKNADDRAKSDFEFLSGDLNVRTSAHKSKEDTFKHYSGRGDADVGRLATADELVGSAPWTAAQGLSGNLLTYINTGIASQRMTFQEGDWSFMPTYKIAEASKCAEKKAPCYSEQRAISWTDRILYTGGTCTKYTAMYLEDSDHYPVIAEYRLG